jgi:hypothetical protein
MRVSARVAPAEPIAADLLPGLPEIGQLVDELEGLSDNGQGAMMSITRWVR